MKIHLKDLPPDTVFQLTRIVREKGMGTSAFFHPIWRVWLVFMGLISLAIGLLSAWILMYERLASPHLLEALLPWVGLTGLVYGPLALVEYLRVVSAELRPFLLLTPFNLIRCKGSHRPLEMYRLSEASAFRRVEEYDGAKWKGQAYTFEFDGGHKVHFTLSQRQDVEAANRTLDLARGERLPDGSQPPGDLCPNHLQGLPRESNAQQFLDPASELWLVALGLLLIGMMLWAVLRTFFR